MSKCHASNNLFRSTLVALAISATGGAVLAADMPASEPAAVSKDTREKMAVLHEHMAACLRSDKSIAECRNDMTKNCQSMLGKNGCPMMGMHHGARHQPTSDLDKK